MRKQHVVTGLERRSPALQARGVRTLITAEECRAPGLVVRDPVTHAIAKPPAHRIGEDAEFVDRVAIAPAAEFLQPLRQVPVIKRRPGLQPALEHAVDQARIEIEARSRCGPFRIPFGRMRGQAMEKR